MIQTYPYAYNGPAEPVRLFMLSQSPNSTEPHTKSDQSVHQGAAGEYTVEIEKSYNGKYFRDYVTVTVENTLNDSSITFNGGTKIFLINVPTLNQDYTLDADDFAAMANLINAEYTDGTTPHNGTENGGTYTIIPDSVFQVFFPSTLPYDTNTGIDIDFDFTWSGNGNAVEYSMSDVKVIFVPAAQ